ncbi:HPP family protein [Coprinopsis cinerea okayama7|uniref:HPP family protein n=1 Tax=Coprinopsis cinerea (strain Okayama-7 / 130 / ATCC MYA-4618 / FGSC 9003) TaxID=240176 RepID=A8P4S4_COPC7|nr:HPP family protein [Coprinopsis cinerea okayama7\|eukprot:XP_001838801.1 HPP family protein [Coprinopsis cinerea okayama7\
MTTSKSRLARLPKWISFWLGYRETPPPPEPAYAAWLWSFIGAFSGISLVQALFGHVPYFVNKGVPSIGATAVLIYGAIESPLAQPRNVMGGHFISAIIGICITKLFLLLPTEERFMELCWLAGSLSCAVALVIMQMTGTTHPPAGATALLAAINPEIRRIGWLYIPVVILSSTIAVLVALFTNNMQRRYPTYWWTPDDVDEKKGPILPTVTPMSSEPPTPTDSTAVSRRTSISSFDGNFDFEKELQKHQDKIQKAQEERDKEEKEEKEAVKPGDHNV